MARLACTKLGDERQLLSQLGFSANLIPSIQRRYLCACCPNHSLHTFTSLSTARLVKHVGLKRDSQIHIPTVVAGSSGLK